MGFKDKASFPRKRAANGSVALRPKQKRGGNKQLWVPTAEDRHTVQLGISWGLSEEAICSQIINPQTGLPISVETLNKNFYFDLKNGKQLAMGRVASALYDSAIRLRDTRAGIFLLKARGNWREEGESSPPVAPGGVLVLPADASPEAWAKELREYQQGLAKREGEADA